MKKTDIAYTNIIVSDNSLSYRYFIKDTKNARPLPIEEEHSLLKEYYKTKDIAIRNKIVFHHQTFIIGLAKIILVKHKKCTLSDLINEGNIGLMIAIDRFDITKGFRLLSYAVWWIRNSMMDFTALSETVSKKGVVSIIGKIENFERQYLKENKFEANSSIIAFELKQPKQLVEYIQNIKNGNDPADNTTIVNLNNYSGLDNDLNFDDYCDQIDNNTLRSEIISMLKKQLSERDKMIVMLHYGIGYERDYSLNEIAYLFDFSHERIRQIIIAFKVRMRHNKYSKSKMLKKYN